MLTKSLRYSNVIWFIGGLLVASFVFAGVFLATQEVSAQAKAGPGGIPASLEVIEAKLDLIAIRLDELEGAPPHDHEE